MSNIAKKIQPTVDEEARLAVEAWARLQPSSIARAVNEGYPYAAGVASIVVKALMEIGIDAQKRANIENAKSPSYTNEIPKGFDRDTPDEKAFTLHDDLRGLLREFHKQPWCPPYTEFELTRIRRCTPGTEDKPAKSFTAVILVIRNPIFGKRVVVIPTE